MRLIIKAGVVPETLTLRASADGDSPVGRWFSANVSLGLVLQILGMIVATAGLYAANQTHFATIDEVQKADHALIMDNRKTLERLERRLSDDYVKREEIEQGGRQTQQLLNNLSAGQQQIFSLMLQRDRSR